MKRHKGRIGEEPVDEQKMERYILVSSGGSTQDEEGTDWENLQILDYEDFDSLDDARSYFLKKYDKGEYGQHDSPQIWCGSAEYELIV